MNKTELVEKVASKTGLTLKDAKTVVDSIFSAIPKEGIIAGELNAGHKVQITGFGTFQVRPSADSYLLSSFSCEPGRCRNP